MRSGRAVWVVLALSASAQRATPALAEEPPKDGAPAAKPPPPKADERPIRPPPFKDDLPAPSHPKTRHVSVGVSAVALSMPADGRLDSGALGRVDYAPTVGMGVDVRFPIFRWLEAGVTATFALPSIRFDSGALGPPGTYDAGPIARVQGEFRGYPTLPLSRWVSLFAMVGVGFGRLEFPEVDVVADHTTTLDPRGASYFFVPLGLGASFTLIDRWLSLDLSVDVSPMIIGSADAFEPAQGLDRGKKVKVAPFPSVDATYRQTLGISLIL